MNYCKTCNAGYDNSVERILRCMGCVVQPGKPHSKYIPIKEEA